MILLHGNGGDRSGMLMHAGALAQGGFGVLLYDQRACGESEGEQRTYGWLDDQDVLAALDYLRSRGDVDKNRITESTPFGILGVSLGGQIAIRAVVTDGTAIAVAGDIPPPVSFEEGVYIASNCVVDWGLWLKTGVAPPDGVVEEIGKIAPRPLLIIATGLGGRVKGWELRFGRRLYQAAGEPKALWEIPEAYHGGGLAARPDEYARRIAEFF